MKSKLSASFRLILGLLFVISAGGKILEPYQNFLAVIQEYNILPSSLEETVAYLFPWFELLVGVFILLGLYLRWALYGSLAMTTCFIIVVGQAIARGLDIAECGCFGELMSFPLEGVILIDVTLLASSIFLLCNLEATKQWGLDRYFETQ